MLYVRAEIFPSSAPNFTASIRRLGAKLLGQGIAHRKA